MDPLSISEEALPLSLQTICLLFVVVNINEYSSSILSLLPASLRRGLVTFMPAVAVHRLEGTPFTEDVNTEELVWSQLYSATHYKLQKNEYQFVKEPFDGIFTHGIAESGPLQRFGVRSCKDRLLDIAVNVLIESNRHRYMPIRKTVLPFTNLVTMRNLVIDQESTCSASMSNFMKYFRLTCHGKDLIMSENFKLDPVFLGGSVEEAVICVNECIKLLSNQFNKHPRAVITHIIGPKILKTSFLAQYLFSQEVECLCLCGAIPSFPGVHGIFRNNTSLKVLLVNTELSHDAFYNIAPYFSSVRSRKIGGRQPRYSNLEQLSVGKFILKRQEQHLVDRKNPITDVASIISFQRKLEFVRLYGYFGHTSATDSLMSSLLKLIRQPQLKSLIVEGHDSNCQVSVERFSKLVLRFLLNPALHPQYLAFTNFQLCETSFTRIKMAKLRGKVSDFQSTSDSYTHSKSLDITGIQLPDHIIKLLSQIRVSFHTLKLGLDSLTARYYMSDLREFFGNSRVYILSRNLLVDLETDVVSAADGANNCTCLLAKQVAHFVSLPSVQSLRVNSIKLDTPGKCETISKALSCEAVANKSLSSIQFNNCFFNEMNLEGLQFVFAGLITLAQSVKLEVKLTSDVSTISDKFMSGKHINTVIKAWTALTGGVEGVTKRQIYKLECCIHVDTDEDPKELLLKMEEVVENFSPIFC